MRMDYNKIFAKFSSSSNKSLKTDCWLSSRNRLIFFSRCSKRIACKRKKYFVKYLIPFWKKGKIPVTLPLLNLHKIKFVCFLRQAAINYNKYENKRLKLQTWSLGVQLLINICCFSYFKMTLNCSIVGRLSFQKTKSTENMLLAFSRRLVFLTIEYK